jgi:hypothetical protein
MIGSCGPWLTRSTPPLQIRSASYICLATWPNMAAVPRTLWHASRLIGCKHPGAPSLVDHEVHEKSSTFLTSMAQDAYYGFSVGDMRFITMNAFDAPDPEIVFPCCRSRWSGSDTSLKRGHNDGHTLYTVTRSTGQVEEGPVSFSVTSLDRGSVSRRFFELGKLPAVMITLPSTCWPITVRPKAIAGIALLSALRYRAMPKSRATRRSSTSCSATRRSGKGRSCRSPARRRLSAASTGAGYRWKRSRRHDPSKGKCHARFSDGATRARSRERAAGVAGAWLVGDTTRPE